MAGPTISEQATAIVKAAHAAGVPAAILLGVYAEETTFGTNHNTSSTGAMGPFQFEPATAKTWNYPMTNYPTAAQFQQQATAAANYLASLFKGSKSWDAAVTSYSGGGYNATDAMKLASQGALSHIDLFNAITNQAIAQHTGDKSVSGGVITNAVIEGSNTAATVANAASGVTSGIGNIATMVTSTDFWLRIGEGIAAVLLIYLGLHALTGQSSSAGAQVKHVTRIIPI